MRDLAHPNVPVVGYIQNTDFGVLGPLEVVEGDHRYSLGGPKQRAVLALLISQAGLRGRDLSCVHNLAFPRVDESEAIMDRRRQVIVKPEGFNSERVAAAAATLSPAG